MKKLIKGILEFRESLTEEKRALFEKLALGQKPDALFIACSDSRVVPNLFASTDPGDLFVLRNVGNLVPPEDSKDASTSAALEFALFSLDVSDIVICGHSECGAMQALLEGGDMFAWLEHGKESLEKTDLLVDPALSKLNQLSQANVLKQMEHLLTYPFVRERIEKNQLRIHGWWFDIHKVAVFYYKQEAKKFVLIGEE